LLLKAFVLWPTQSPLWPQAAPQGNGLLDSTIVAVRQIPRP
jgi:hypothetical protein